MANDSKSGTSWLGALCLVAGMILVMMKATGNLDWDWWIVLIPLYPIMFGIVFWIGVFILFFAVMLVLLPIRAITTAFGWSGKRPLL